MIDTDKYENITPERWAVDEEDPFRVVDVQDCTIARTNFVNIEGEREWQLANAQLIADAPLLLAEVNRLQKELRKQTNIVGMISDLVYDGGSHNLTWDELNEILGDVVKE